MKKMYAVLLSLIMVLSLTTGAFAQTQAVSVHVENEELSFAGGEPVIENHTVLAPARTLFEALQLDFAWDGQAGELTVAKDDHTLVLRVDEYAADWNGESQTLVAPARNVQGVTHVPVRFISEAFGYDVTWSSAERTVVIDENGEGTEPAPAPDPEETEAASRGYLWEVEHEGTTVYLLGSIHVADSSMYPLHPNMEEAFAASDSLTLEIDLSQSMDPEIVQTMMELSTYQDGTTLPDHISEDTYEQLVSYLEEKGMDGSDMDLFRPWFAATTIENLAMAGEGYQAELGIDMYFLQHALEREMPVLELETYESQLSIFNEMSAESQEQMLLDAIHYTGESWGIDELAHMWIEGSDEALSEMIEEMKQEDEEFYQAMLPDRNIPMTEKIEAYLQDDDDHTYFVIVGAAHMLGETGIVTLLEDKGYEVIRR